MLHETFVLKSYWVKRAMLFCSKCVCELFVFKGLKPFEIWCILDLEVISKKQQVMRLGIQGVTQNSWHITLNIVRSYLHLQSSPLGSSTLVPVLFCYKQNASWKISTAFLRLNSKHQSRLWYMFQKLPGDLFPVPKNCHHVFCADKVWRHFIKYLGVPLGSISCIKFFLLKFMYLTHVSSPGTKQSSHLTILVIGLKKWQYWCHLPVSAHSCKHFWDPLG